jgi:hypothetical protein
MLHQGICVLLHYYYYYYYYYYYWFKDGSLTFLESDLFFYHYQSFGVGGGAVG